jgi:hypothetical protein
MKLTLCLIILGLGLVSCGFTPSETSLQRSPTAGNPPTSSATMTTTFSTRPPDVTPTMIKPNPIAANTTTRPSFTPTHRPTSTVAPSSTPSPTLGAIGQLRLRFYGLALDYATDIWQLGEDEWHRGLLQHKSISNCRVREWGQSEVYGDLLNRLTLGKIVYEIWGWSNPETGIQVHHYLARSGFENPSAPDIPDVEVILPYTNSKQCALDANAVLATLHMPSK